MAYGMVDLIQFAEGSAAENWIQIMKTGKWQHPKLKEVSITQKDLAQFKDNFDRKVRGVDLAVDVSHNPDTGAVGWFKELRVDGDKLMAKVDWTEEGAQLVKSGKYRYFSPEFMFSWKDPATGQEHKDVLLGGALTNRPFLKNMEPVAFSETGMGEVWFSDNENYDPDQDGDDDSTTNPKSNPDWMQDVVEGITRWPSDPKQQKVLTDAGHTKAKCDATYERRQKAVKMMEDDFAGYVLALFAERDVTNAHKSPPKGKPQNKNQYADPDNYKYPIDETHIHAALGYFNQGGQKSAGGYSDDQWASIGRKIVSAANRLIGPGHKFVDGKIETPSTKMSDTSIESDDNPDDGETDAHDNDDVDAGEFTDPAAHNRNTNGGGSVNGKDGKPEGVVSLAEFQAAQQEIIALKEQTRRAQMTEKVRGWMFDEKNRTGKLVPAQQDKVVDMLMAMSDDQVAKFEEFVNELPASISFDELGFSGAVPTGKNDKADQVVKLAEKYEREEHMAWHDAFIRASDELGVK